MLEKKQWIIADEETMLAFAAALAKVCEPPCIIFLRGELGAGKTTLVRGFLRGLHYEGRVKSPTYTLVEPYLISNKQIYHFDLYRVKDPRELTFMGIEEYFSATAICLIEWPQQGEPLLPLADLDLQIEVTSSSERAIAGQAYSEQGQRMLENIVKNF